MSIVGPSGSGKSRLIFELLRQNVFYPNYKKVLYFYQSYQPLFQEMSEKIPNIEFIGCIDFDMINELPSNVNHLLIFDDSCEEISKSKDFVKLATAGRHKGIHVVYVKHNLFHKSSLGRDVELQNTHIVLFKSPRDVQQVQKLATQLGLGKQLVDWYNNATSKPYGYLMIDLSPRTVDSLRYSSGLNPSIFYLPKSKAKVTRIEDEWTNDLYSQKV
ncbi:MAG: hypothetical protein AAF757_18665 [Cyanobacteria bacterium P01_D01_bin.116]